MNRNWRGGPGLTIALPSNSPPTPRKWLAGEGGAYAPTSRPEKLHLWGLGDGVWGRDCKWADGPLTIPSPKDFILTLQGFDLPGEAGDLAGRGAPVQGAFAGHPGDHRNGLLQCGLGLLRFILGHGLAHVAHRVLHSGLAALVAQPPLFILPGPLQGGYM